MRCSIASSTTPIGSNSPARACANARRQNQRDQRPLDLPQRDHDHPPRPAGRRRPGRLQIGMVAGFTSEQRPASGSVPPAGFVGIPTLFTALRTGFALELLQEAFKTTRELRAQRRAERGLAPGQSARGLGKLLVVAPDQKSARLYLDWLRGWMSPARAEHEVQLATSGERHAHESLAAFRLTAEPSVLVTVAMAYEGLDAPEVAVVAALTHIRSRPWLEQMIARATRVDPNAGTYETQRALVFHPDDPLFAKFRQRIETEQGTSARRPKHKRQAELPLWLQERIAEQDRDG